MTERENLAEAERRIRHLAALSGGPQFGDWGHVARIMDEYDRRGREIDGLKYRLEAEASFTAAHQASALKWGAAVADQRDDIDGLRAERDEALGLLRELVAGADDSRCWWIPAEVMPRIRALVERASQGGET